MDIYVPHMEQSGSPIGEKRTISELKKLMKDIIKAAVEVATRRIVTEIMAKTMEHAFMVESDVHKEEIKTPIRHVAEEALITIPEQGLADTILMHNVDALVK